MTTPADLLHWLIKDPVGAATCGGAYVFGILTWMVAIGWLLIKKDEAQDE